MGGRAGLRPVREEGTAVEQSLDWATQQDVSQNKQTHTSKQASKQTKKTPRAREVAPRYSACPGPGYYPSVTKRKTMRKLKGLPSKRPLQELHSFQS